MEDEVQYTDPLVGWVLKLVDSWVTFRESNFDDKWNEYYRLWRGIHKNEDKNRDSERSKLVHPALSQAIEATVSELEEATFGRGRWIDVEDDEADPRQSPVGQYVTKLIEEYEFNGVPSAISETYLNGALYGTGIGKIIVYEEDGKFRVGLVAIDPANFAIDPAARSIEEAMGCAHVTTVPKHTITEKQKAGIYKDVDLGDWHDDRNMEGRGEMKDSTPDSRVKIVEYHGLVPLELLDEDTDENFSDVPEIEDAEMVESIVTIANDGVLLKAVRNPIATEDRAFIAYQHDTVPNRFWGRGVAEKGYSPQKALDAEMRARIDALALSTHPMLAMDATRLPRGADFSVRPGRNILTNGDPNQVIREFKFSAPDPSTFRQAGELERAIQMGTGAIDSATPVGVSPRNETASGLSMIMAGAIKRTKRTMQNIERSFLDKFVQKSLLRYWQFAPNEFPPEQDLRVKVHATMGIMAREFEQVQLTQLLSTVPPGSPAYWILLRSIYENSSLENKEEMIQVIEKMMESAMQPEQSFEEKLKMKELELEAVRSRASAQEDLASALEKRMKAAKLRDEITNSDVDRAIQMMEANAGNQGEQGT